MNKNYYNGGCETCLYAHRDEQNRYTGPCYGYSNCCYVEFEGEVGMYEFEKDELIEELKEKLKHCIELPKGLDVGKPVYFVRPKFDDDFNTYYTLDLGFVQSIKKSINRRGKGFYNFLVRYKSGLVTEHTFDDFDSTVFTSKSKARIKLEEMKK